MQLKQQQTLNPPQDQMNALANLYHLNQIISKLLFIDYLNPNIFS